MIAYLAGELREKTPSHVVLLVGGVGYKLFIPVSTYYGLPELGTEVALRVHTHVREDALSLYGFASALEEVLFQRLISVAGVGPSLALKVMAGLEPPVLVDALRRSDLKRLNAIPGVGRKTAERLVLELRDKMPEVTLEGPAGADVAPRAAPSVTEDLVSALLNLGFARAQVEKEAKGVVADEPDIGFEDALKKTLRKLAG